MIFSAPSPEEGPEGASGPVTLAVHSMADMTEVSVQPETEPRLRVQGYDSAKNEGSQSDMLTHERERERVASKEIEDLKKRQCLSFINCISW